MSGEARSYATVNVALAEHICTITLNRPERFNACSRQLMADLGEALSAAAADGDVRVVILTGAGSAFCSGQDLAELKDSYAQGEPPELARILHERYNPVIERMGAMRQPIIGAINGIAAGAGCSLALACDMRLASESAAFMEAFINVGLAPDAGSTYFLPRLIGHAAAMEMCCTGRKIEADEALRRGLVNRIVPADRLMDEAMSLARTIASKSAPAIAATRRLLNQSLTASLDWQLASEAEAQDTLAGNADHLEGVMAFIEKRKPRFKGR
ncbi:MAG: enoyl-CoA hydratase-related protein [Planctomycetota bacterium]|nr:enoyl-CoA hydratase-related protein [Planctomycetota bacterium]